MKRSWHWVVGLTGIVLFGILFLIRLEILNNLFSETEQMVIPVPLNVPTGETWMNIHQGGQKIGYAQRINARIKEGFRFSEYLFMWINTMGVVQPLSVKTTAELKPDRTLSSFQFELGSKLFQFVARGSVSGKELKVYIGEHGEEKAAIKPLTEPIYLGGGILETLAVAELKKGEGKTFPIFDPASMDRRSVRIVHLGEESLENMGKIYQTRKMSVEFLGMKQVAWLDQDGTVIREQGILGIVLNRVSKEEALSGLEGAFGSDLTEIASIASSQPIDHAAALKTLKIRLTVSQDFSFSNAKGNRSIQKDMGYKLLDSFQLDGDRQIYRNGILTIHRESPNDPSLQHSSVVGNLNDFLKPTPFIQSDHQKIKGILADIVSRENSDGTKASKLVDWVHKSIEKRPVLSVPNAVETLERRMGDCNEHAVLLAALARSAGIPAEVEAGLVYLRGRFFYHAWNVFYLRDWGGWVTADAALGQMPADVTHVRFIRGNADRQLGLMGLVGRLTLQVLEIEK